jgi:hypothetical protein
MMISTERARRQGIFRGCIVPLVAVVGVLAACFFFCEVLFLLNQGGGTTVSPIPIPTPTPAGGASLFLLLGI